MAELAEDGRVFQLAVLRAAWARGRRVPRNCRLSPRDEHQGVGAEPGRHRQALDLDGRLGLIGEGDLERVHDRLALQADQRGVAGGVGEAPP